MYGIDEPAPDTMNKPISSDVSEKLKKCKNLGININEDDIEVAHHIVKRLDHQGDYPSPQQNVKSHPILCRFKTQQIRNKILKKVRSLMSQKQTRMKFGSFRVRENFTERVRDVRRKLVPHLK